VSTTATVLSALLILVALAAGIPKIRLKGDIPENLQQHLGVSAPLTRFIGLAQVTAATGLAIGIFWHPLGTAAACGLTALFAGAIGYHQRAGDYADPKTRGSAMAPIVLALVSLAAAATTALSA
jgi:hypothetical protein